MILAVFWLSVSIANVPTEAAASSNGRETVPAMIGGNDFFGGVQYLENWVLKYHFGFPQKPEKKYLRGGISLPPLRRFLPRLSR